MLAAGCGGGDDGPSADTRAVASGSTATTTESTTGSSDPPRGRARYIAKADTFCGEILAGPEGRRVVRGARALRSMSTRDPEFAPAAAEHYRRVLNVARRAATDFRRIEPPPEDEARVDEYVAASLVAVDRLEEIVASLERGVVSRRDFGAYVAALSEADRVAKAYGFDVCGRVG